MGTNIWVVSEGADLHDRVVELMGDEGRAVQYRSGEACDLPVPGPILLECD